MVYHDMKQLIFTNTIKLSPSDKRKKKKKKKKVTIDSHKTIRVLKELYTIVKIENCRKGLGITQHYAFLDNLMCNEII